MRISVLCASEPRQPEHEHPFGIVECAAQQRRSRLLFQPKRLFQQLTLREGLLRSTVARPALPAWSRYSNAVRELITRRHTPSQSKALRGIAVATLGRAIP